MKLYGIVQHLETLHNEVIETEVYSTKAAFKECLKGNGFKVKFIFSDKDYDKVMKKVARGDFMNLSKKEDMIYQIIAS